MGDPVQARRALNKATRQRVNASRLKLALAEGRVDWRELLLGNVADEEETAARMRVEQLLLAVPGIGPVTCGEALQQMGLKQEDRLGPMGFAGREVLADLLRSALDPLADSEPDA